MQILINLITNSIKFTIKGGITVEITQSCELAKISVHDTGVGINPRIQKKIFKEYATFKQGPIGNTRGTGLGLVICKSYVSILGPSDEIQIQSEEKVFSQFFFFIYLVLSDPYQEPLPKDDIDAPDVSPEVEKTLFKLPESLLKTSYGAELLKRIRRSLLLQEDATKLFFCVVDDLTYTVRTLEKMLNQCGITKIQVFFDGYELVEWVKKEKEQKIDALIIDNEMPILSGLSTVEELKSMNYIIKHKVICSANEIFTQPEVKKSFNYQLKKPVILQGIAFLLVEILENMKK